MTRRSYSRRAFLGTAGTILAGAGIMAGGRRTGLAQAGPTPTPGAPKPGDGPWTRNLMIRTSTDGTIWNRADVWTPASGVPCLLRDAQDRLLAAFQWFPDRASPHWDRVAVRISEDDGNTWGEPQPIVIEDYPPPYQRPFDPTLALTAEGKIRIYFSATETMPRPGTPAIPATYSAISDDGVNYTFESEPRFAVEDKMVIDPAVIRLGERWFYSAPNNVKGVLGGVFRGVSDDGLTFTRLADREADNRLNWTGNYVAVGDGVRFYGNMGQGEIWWAYSEDNATWTETTLTNVRGGDPAVITLKDGSYLMIEVG